MIILDRRYCMTVETTVYWFMSFYKKLEVFPSSTKKSPNFTFFKSFARSNQGFVENSENEIFFVSLYPELLYLQSSKPQRGLLKVLNHYRRFENRQPLVFQLGRT